MFNWRKTKKPAAPAAPKPHRTPSSSPHPKQSLLSLEQRLMFDAAAAATASEVASEQVAQEQADAAVSSDGSADQTSTEQTESQELLQAIVSYSPGESTTEVAFIDPTVPDYESLVAGMGSNVEIIMLDATHDGMEQIAESLADRSGIDAIHLITHGAEGRLNIGTGALTHDSMTGQYADELATIQQALSEQADILVYGCDFAEGQAGQEAATLQSQLTGADVAASTDATGFAGLGGDWVLETQIGTVETQVAVDDGVQANWVGLLAGELPPTITNLSGDSLSYSEGVGPVVIEQSGNALVADVDSTNLDTGTLTVSIPAGGDSAEDVLSIQNQGTGAGQIGVSGTNVTYGGVTIGTFTGGSEGSNLVITLNSSATPTAVTALVNNITYENTDTAAPTTGARTVRYVLTDGDGGTSANYDTTVTVGGTNDAPTDLSLSANTVAENATNGTVVGTVSGADPDSGDTKSYSLTDTAGGRFAINSSTGVLTVANGSLLNYESAASHSVTVRVTDSGGLTYDEAFTINLTNVNEAPTLVGWYNSEWAYRKEVTIDHTQVVANQNDFAVLVKLGVDADLQSHALPNGNDIVFTAADGVTKLNAQIEKYSSANGELVAWVRVPSLSSVTDTRLFLYYGDPAASNQQNATGVWDAHTTAVYHLNESGEPYVDSTGNANTGSAIGNPAQTTGEVGMGQVFDGVTTSVTIPNSAANNFADNFTISAWVKLNATGQADIIEKGGTGGYALWLNGTSMWVGKQYAPLEGWAKSTTSLTTGVWYKFDGVVSNGIASLYVNGNLENTAASANSNANSGALQIGNGIDGHLNGIIDEVRVSDTVRSASWIATAFKNESAAHTFESFGAQGSDRLIGTNEDTTSSGTVVSEILTNGKWNDVDTGAIQGVVITSKTGNGAWQYSADGITWSSFGPVAVNNALLLAATSQVRYIPDGINGETATFSYKAWDQTSGTASTNPTASYGDPGGGGGSTAFSSQTLTEIMAIISVNDAPTDLALSVNTVAENAANGTVVGTITGTDPDSGDTLSYSLTDTAGGRFAINSATGQITVADGTLLDYEAAASHSITVRTTDAGGLTHDQTLTIALTNVNETPTGADATVMITEDMSHMLTASNFGFSDVDAGDALSSVRIDSLPGAGSLTLSGVAVTAGQVITVADINVGNLVFTPAADANGTGYASFTFSVCDSNNAYDAAPNIIMFNVTAVNDTPIFAANTGSTVAEGGSDGITDGELSVADVDNTAAQLTFSVGTGPAYGRLELTTAPGVPAITFTQADIIANRLVYIHDGSETTNDSFTFTVNDGVGGTLGSTTVTLTMTPVNDAPTITSGGGGPTASLNVAENVTSVTIITGADVDLPAQTLAYGISGGADQALFTIDAATGALSFVAPRDFEAATDANGDNVYVVQVRVVDTQGGMVTQAIQVTVTDVVEGVSLGPVTPALLPSLIPTPPPPVPGTPPFSSSPAGPQSPAAPVPSSMTPTGVPDIFSVPPASRPDETSHGVAFRPDELRRTDLPVKDHSLPQWSDEQPSSPFIIIPVEAAGHLEFEEPISPNVVSDVLMAKLDAMAASLKQVFEVDQEQHALMARVAALTGMTLSIGFVAWALRSSVLLASCLATLPAWKNFDPLPVLSLSRRELNRRQKATDASQQQEQAEFDGLQDLFAKEPPFKPKA